MKQKKQKYEEISDLDELDDISSEDDDAGYEEIDDKLWDVLLKLKNKYPDKAFKPVGKEGPHHKAWFSYYWCLGSKRSNKLVADKFNKSAAAVGRANKSFHWEARLEYMEKEKMEASKKASNTSVADSLNTYLMGCQLVQTSFANQVRKGDVKITVKDYMEICDKELELLERRVELSKLPGMEGLRNITESMEALGNDGKLIMREVFKQSMQNQLPIDEQIYVDELREIQEHMDTAEIGDDYNEE